MSDAAYYELAVDLVNEDEHYIFARFAEPATDVVSFKVGESADNVGDIYRAAQREFGRCMSSIYQDRKEGPPIRVGWYFTSRQRYEDSDKPYLRGAWVRVVRVEPEVRSAVDIPGGALR